MRVEGRPEEKRTGEKGREGKGREERKQGRKEREMGGDNTESSSLSPPIEIEWLLKSTSHKIKPTIPNTIHHDQR